MYLDEDQRQMEISVREIAFSATVSSGEKYVSRRLRALIGHQAHSTYQKESDAMIEYYLKFPMKIDGWDVLIRGRVDIVDKQGDTIFLEEIKSTVRSLKNQDISNKDASIQTSLSDHDGTSPSSAVQSVKKSDQSVKDLLDEAYQLQLQIYCHYFYHFEGFSKIKANLVLIDPINEKIQKIEVKPRPMEEFLTSFISNRIKIHLHEKRMKEELKRRVETIEFPFDRFRPHQAEIIKAIKDKLSTSPRLLLHAPPGIGKTISSLFPFLRYGISEGLRIFTVTSKTTQQLIYKETIQFLQEHGAQFKAIRITAKGKMCKTEKYDCYDNDCPYFENYLTTDTRDTIAAILELDMIDRDNIEYRAARERICPFELSLDVATGCDVILSDFNYIFHPRVQFQRFQSEFENSLLIIDEAHNLVDRARDYFSDQLSIAEIKEVVAFVRQTQISSQLRYQVRSHLQRIIRYIQRIKDQIINLEADHSLIKIDLDQVQSFQEKLDILAIEYLNALPFIPEKKDILIKFTDKLKFFTLLLRESSADEFEQIYDLREKQIRIYCTSAANKLAENMSVFDGVIAQSATLQPMEYYQHMLGMDEVGDTMEYTHPFNTKNRLYLVDTMISTTYRERVKFFDIIAEHIMSLISIHAGNYLVFFPSFSFMSKVSQILSQRITDDSFSLIEQEPAMADKHRDHVLQHLSQSSNNLLLAVMGGIFSEGVDYKGDMASGAFVIGPGLPQINFDNELIRSYFDQTLGKGFDYAYKYPGMAKVIQSAGRVFRSESDVGFVIFMGHRFSTPAYGTLFPKEYNVEAGDLGFLKNKIKQFWDTHHK